VSLETDLPGAARRGELVAYFQPQVEVASGRIIAAEALCRWQHPRLGAIAPTEFVAVAEESGAIHEIGDFMIEQSCAFAASADAAGIEVAVNVSAVQLGHPDFSARLIAAYERHGVAADRLTVELTESRPVIDLPDAVAQLERLRALGTGISMDDFGSGFSSLAQLNALPFTELKIDQSLIRDDTEETWTHVASLVAVARHRGMRIVVEGVETREQYERVRDADCDRAQGYYLGTPMPRDEFAAFLRANSRTALPALGASARRALLAAGIRNLEDAAARTRRELAALHGIGPKTVARLDAALATASLVFSN
jgi:EAL domain-containing protein (putative c-di-GMP-specific phosphodiesterase class I)